MIERISERAAFERLTREGTRVRSGVLWCTMLTDPTLRHPRVAYAIGRAVGPAVIRNRQRRRLRHLVAARAPRLVPGWYLIGVTPAGASATSAALAADLDRLLDRLPGRLPRPSVTDGPV